MAALRALLIVAAGLALGAEAGILFDNGAIINSGANISIFTQPGHQGFGYTAALGFVLAEDFIVSGTGWRVESLSFYAYQTGAVAFPIASASWSIRQGTDISTATTVASATAAAVTNGGFVGYRVRSIEPALTNRAIYKIDVDVPDFSLEPGNYFVTITLTALNGASVFVPPIAALPGTSFQTDSSGAVFSPLIDTGDNRTPVGIPFTISGFELTTSTTTTTTTTTTTATTTTSTTVPACSPTLPCNPAVAIQRGVATQQAIENFLNQVNNFR